MQRAALEAEEVTSYLDDNSNFFTASRPFAATGGGGGGSSAGSSGIDLSLGSGNPLVEAPDLLGAISRHNTRDSEGVLSPQAQAVRLAAEAGSNPDTPGETALKNLLLLSHTMPKEVDTKHTITPHHRDRVNHARQKWGVIEFKDPDAIKFRAQLNQAIIDHRRACGQYNCIPKFPDKVPREALKYYQPRFGPEWETFDSTKHIDYVAKEQIDARKSRLDALKTSLQQRQELQQQQGQAGAASTGALGGGGASHPVGTIDGMATHHQQQMQDLWGDGLDGTGMDDDEDVLLPLDAALGNGADYTPVATATSPGKGRDGGAAGSPAADATADALVALYASPTGASSPGPAQGAQSPSPPRNTAVNQGGLPVRKSTVNMQSIAPFFRTGYSHFDAKPPDPTNMYSKGWGELYDEL